MKTFTAWAKCKNGHENVVRLRSVDVEKAVMRAARAPHFDRCNVCGERPDIRAAEADTLRVTFERTVRLLRERKSKTKEEIDAIVEAKLAKARADGLDEYGCGCGGACEFNQ